MHKTSRTRWGIKASATMAFRKKIHYMSSQPRYAVFVQEIISPQLRYSDTYSQTNAGKGICRTGLENEDGRHAAIAALLSLPPELRCIARSPLTQCSTIHGCCWTSSSVIRFSGSSTRSYVILIQLACGRFPECLPCESYSWLPN